MVKILGNPTVKTHRIARRIVFTGCYQRGARYGPVVICNPGDVVTGVCSSGKDANCRQVGANYTTINCCKISVD